jgi:hypothetical protein
MVPLTPGIVYCLSRKDCETISAKLNEVRAPIALPPYPCVHACPCWVTAWCLPSLPPPSQPKPCQLLGAGVSTYYHAGMESAEMKRAHHESWSQNRCQVWG